MKCTFKLAKCMVCTFCLNKAANSDFLKKKKSAGLVISGGTTMSTSQAPLFKRDRNTKIRGTLFIKPEKQRCTMHETFFLFRSNWNICHSIKPRWKVFLCRQKCSWFCTSTCDPPCPGYGRLFIHSLKSCFFFFLISCLYLKHGTV